MCIRDRHRPPHRGRSGRRRPQRPARPRRQRPHRAAPQRAAGPPVRRRRQPRATYPARLDPRVCRALPPRARPGAGVGQPRDGPHRVGGQADGQPRRGPAPPRPARLDVYKRQSQQSVSILQYLDCQVKCDAASCHRDAGSSGSARRAGPARPAGSAGPAGSVGAARPAGPTGPARPVGAAASHRDAATPAPGARRPHRQRPDGSLRCV